MKMAFGRLISWFRLSARAGRAAAALMVLVVSVPAALAEPEELIWEDLLPPGEVETLNKLYEDFYADLEKRMFENIANAKTFYETEAAKGNNDAVYTPDDYSEGGALDTMPQLGTFNVVEDLDGLDVRLPGYVVPLSFRQNNKYREFLLVPYYGACLHSPPPPPNQIVYVKTEKTVKIEDIWSPYWVEGQMHTTRHENETGNAAYTLSLHKLSLYDD